MRDPAPSGLFTVRATRSGTPVQKPDQILMAIDFAKPLQPERQSRRSEVGRHHRHETRRHPQPEVRESSSTSASPT